MPVKIDPRLQGSRRMIGNWGRVHRLAEPRNIEKEALKITLNPVKPEHAPHSKAPPAPRSIRVRMLKNVKAAPDGIHVVELQAGKTYEVPEAMAKRFIKKKLAKKYISRRRKK